MKYSIDDFLPVILWKEINQSEFNTIFDKYLPSDDFKEVFISRDVSTHGIYRFELYRNKDFKPILLKHSFKERNSGYLEKEKVTIRSSSPKITWEEPIYTFFKHNSVI